MNARKPPVGVWQLSTSAAADGGVIGFSLVDEDKAFDCQIDGARIEIPSAMAANTVGTTNCKVIALWIIADTRFDLPHAKIPPSAESGNWKLGARKPLQMGMDFFRRVGGGNFRAPHS